MWMMHEEIVHVIPSLLTNTGAYSSETLVAEHGGCCELFEAIGLLFQGP